VKAPAANQQTTKQQTTTSAQQPASKLKSPPFMAVWLADEIDESGKRW
jgi:hypothetical protein